MFRIAFFFLLASPAAALYSVHFIPGADKNSVMGKHGRFVQSPEAIHVADIYARISGSAPLLHEDVLNLPVLDISSELSEKPILVEVTGGVVSKFLARPIMLSSNAETGPALGDVVRTLEGNGIVVESKKFESMGDASKWVGSQTKPVVLLHHEQLTAKQTQHRLLANSSNAYMPLSEEEISSYQIFYWSFFVFAVLLLTGVMSIFSMEVIPDSLLFAKFQSSRTGKND